MNNENDFWDIQEHVDQKNVIACDFAHSYNNAFDFLKTIAECFSFAMTNITVKLQGSYYVAVNRRKVI